MPRPPTDDPAQAGQGATSPVPAPGTARARRVFVGRQRPPLHAAAEVILGLAPRGHTLDLSGVVVVVPGARSGRLLLNELVHRAHERARARTHADRAGLGLFLAPPLIVTPGELPGVVLGPRPVPPADPLSRRLAWLDAVASEAAAAGAAASSAAGEASEGDRATPPHLGTARLIQRTCDELATEGLLPHELPALLEQAARAGRFSGQRALEEAPRWRALARVARAYRAALNRAGLDDPLLMELDALRAARAAGGTHAEGGSQAAARVEAAVLVAVSELPGSARLAIDVLLRSGGHAVAVVPAPQEFAGSFDELGCVLPCEPEQAWALGCEVPDELLTVVDSPPEAARRTLAELALAARDGWPGRPPPATHPPMHARRRAGANDPARPRRSIAADDAVVGVPDPALVPAILAAADSGVAGEPGVPIHEPSAFPLLRSRPAVLLALAADYLRARTFESLGSLVRHPDLARALLATRPTLRRPEHGQDRWLATLDRFDREQLPDHVRTPTHTNPDPTGPTGPADTDRAAAADVAAEVAAGVDDLLAPLLAPGPRPLLAWPDSGPEAGWAGAIVQVLHAVYRHRPVGGGSAQPPSPAQRRLDESLAALRGELSGADHAPCAALGPPMTAHAAIGMLLDRAGDRALPDADAGAIEALGWLELPLDPAPVLVLTGLNEGFVPAPACTGGTGGGGGGDQYLPNALRRALGLACDERRLARDAHLLAVIVGPRARWRVVLSRTDADGQPAVPSRLLFPADAAARARRVLRLVGGHSPAPSATPLPIDAPLAWHARAAPDAPPPCPIMPVIQPSPLASGAGPGADADLPTRLPVTAFGDYLTSPYAFYLRHVLRLRVDRRPAWRGSGPVADPASFGSILHEAMTVLAEAPLAGCTDARTIAAALREGLQAAADRRLAVRPGRASRRSGTIRSQLQQAQRRLDAAAEVQARHAQAGWRVIACEWRPPAGSAAADSHPSHPAVFAHDGVSIGLTGRIDRIDEHPTQGLRILDYKTGDTPTPAERAHRAGGNGGRWIDLQLPLYRHLAASLIASRAGAAGRPPVGLGYFHLCAELSKIAIDVPQWGEEDLASADAAAAEVVRSVRARRFGFEGSDRGPTDDALAALMGRQLLTTLGEEETP